MRGTLDSHLKTFNTMPDNAKSARKAAAMKKRGMLSARAWEDLRQASRLAHAQGVTLFMHGVKIVPQERYVSKGDTTGSKPRAAATTLTTTERDGRKRQPTVPVGDARDQPSKRQQRSAQRLQDHREKQRAATVHARSHACMHAGCRSCTADGCTLYGRSREHRLEVMAQRLAALRKLCALLWQARTERCICTVTASPACRPSHAATCTSTPRRIASSRGHFTRLY